jgi:hypothetical protein
MVIEYDKKSRVAARLVREAGRINRMISVIVSETAPESTRRTGRKPLTAGWQVVADLPLNSKGRIDYVEYLKKTAYTEVFIRVGTKGGHPKIYVK